MQQFSTVFAGLGVALLMSAEAVAQRGGGGPPSPERMFEFLDRNRNGALDAEELERLPGPMREWANQSGARQSDGSIRQEDFIRQGPQMMEFMRSRRDEDDRRGGPGGFSRDGDRSRSSSGDSRGAESKPESRARVTIDLPADYRERDLNGDGQIALYEWRLWNRTALAQFIELDRNRDGFLVPRELAPKSDEQKNAQTSRGTSSPQRLVVVGRSPSRSSSSDDDRRRDSDNDDDQDREAERARTYFGYLDRNRDGRLTEDEWATSRRLRPMFEDAGVNISREMSQDQFVETYVRISRED